MYDNIYKKKVETFIMAYSNFTLEAVRTTFGLETVENSGYLFRNSTGGSERPSYDRFVEKCAF